MRLKLLSLALLGMVGIAAGAAHAQNNLTGNVSGLRVFVGNLNIFGVTITGNTTIVVMDGDIQITGGGITSATVSAPPGNGAPATSGGEDCATDDATPGSNASNGFNVTISAYDTGGGGGNIVVGAGIDLSGGQGGKGGDGLPAGGQTGKECCSHPPLNGAYGALGGAGGTLQMYAAHNITISNRNIVCNGGRGGDGGFAGGSDTIDPWGANYNAASPGYGGNGAIGGSIKIRAEEEIFIEGDVSLIAEGGAGGNGGAGAEGVNSSKGAWGGDGGEGGVIDIDAVHISAVNTSGDSFQLFVRGGGGGVGGKGGWGSQDASESSCETTGFTYCGFPMRTVRGLAARGGFGGESGDGGSAFVTTTGSIDLPGTSTETGFAAFGQGGGFVGTPLPSSPGAGGDAGGTQGTPCDDCENNPRSAVLGQSPTADAADAGSFVLQVGTTLNAPYCIFNFQGGPGQPGGRGGDISPNNCGPQLLVGGTGGNGYKGGIGGTVSITAGGAVTATGGVVNVCGGPGGPGGDGGCTWGLGGNGGAGGTSGSYSTSGSGTFPTSPSCGSLVGPDGADNDATCP